MSVGNDGDNTASAIVVEDAPSPELSADETAPPDPPTEADLSNGEDEASASEDGGDVVDAAEASADGPSDEATDAVATPSEVPATSEPSSEPAAS